MTIEDIENYIIRYNLNSGSRKAEIIDQRMYLYAYLFHIHNLSLAKTGAMFSYTNNKGKLVVKDHATVRHALRKADYVQHEERFIENTERLNSQLRFVIPPYKEEQFPTSEKFEVCLSLGKERFVEFMKAQNDIVIYDFLWDIMTVTAKKEHEKTIHNNSKYKQKK